MMHIALGHAHLIDSSCHLRHRWIAPACPVRINRCEPIYLDVAHLRPWSHEHEQNRNEDAGHEQRFGDSFVADVGECHPGTQDR
jgi:hypothetical protein